MEQFNIYQYFLERGLLGVLTAANMVIIVYFWRRYENLRDQIEVLLKEHAQQVQKLQDEKLQMQKEHLDTLLKIKDEVTEVTNRITNSMEILVMTLTAGDR